MAHRFRIEIVEVGDGLYGPDHPWHDEHRVVEIATGRVVLALEETPDLSKPWDPSYHGVSSLSLDDEGGTVTARYHDGTVERFPLP